MSGSPDMGPLGLQSRKTAPLAVLSVLLEKLKIGVDRFESRP
jgi:hypothetical protein